MKLRLTRFIPSSKIFALLTLITCLPSFVPASPTLIDSIGKPQLTGVKVEAITSIFAEDENLWITDKSNQVFQWKLGEPPVSVISGSKKQSFTNAMPIGDNRAILTDIKSNQFLIGTDGNWQAFAEEGELEGKLDAPSAAAWSKDGMIYIADSGNDRISVFSDTGLFLFSFGDDASEDNKEQNLTKIQDIAIDQNGRVYVLDSFTGGRISIYTSLGELDTTIGKDELQLLIPSPVRMIAMTIRPDGILIIADKKSGKIFEIDWENMVVLSSFATAGKGRGQLQRVSSLSLSHDGKLYVADIGNRKIEVFQLDWKQSPWVNSNADKLSIYPSSVLKSACDISYIYAGEAMLCINSKKNSVTLRSYDGVVLQTFDAKFDRPMRAVFDEKEFFILDKKGIKVFDHQGTFKFTFGSSGRRDGELSHASALALTASAVFIADTGNKRVQVFSRNGLFQRSFGKIKGDTNNLVEPSAIAVDKRGNVYVADIELHKVFIYSASGDLRHQIGTNEEQPHAFTNIYDIMIDADDVLYVMVSTARNPLSVWMYHINSFFYRFSPSQKPAKAGFDQQWIAPFVSHESNIQARIKQAKAALSNVSKLSIDPNNPLFNAESSFFGSNNESWMFNKVPNNPQAFTLVDLSKHTRYTFQVLKAPKQVRSITLAGDEQNVELSWLGQGSDFSGYYQVYGRKDIAQPFESLTQTIEPKLNQARTTLSASEYRVAAISPYGKKGKLSSTYQDYFWLGYNALQAGSKEQALTLFKQATENNANHAVAWLYLGQTQQQLGLLDQALQSFETLGNFETYKQQALHWQAQTLMQKHAWLDVKALVDSAESQGSIDALLYSLAAQALIQMDDIPSAIYYLDQAVRLEPTSSTWHLALADANFELGADAHAKEELAVASQLAGQDISAWLEVAKTYKKHQLFDEAVSAYNSVLAIDPAQEQALPELAILHLEQNHLDQARSLATQMASIPALKATSYYVLGRIALAEDKAPQALAMLAKAGQTDPNNAHIWLAMADAYAALNNPNRENEYLKKAASLDGHNFDVHMRLAQSCEIRHDTSCMIEHFTQAMNIDEKNIDAQLGLAKALMQSGKMSEADNHARAALKIKPTSIPAHIVLAEIQSTRGMIPDSIATLKKALALDENNMEAHLSLAKAYIANHMYDEAMAITEKASLLDVRNASPLALTGSIYLARQSFDLAIASFEKATELAPDNPKYRQQLNMAYLQKKRSVDAGGNMLGPKLKDLKFTRVFSSAYKQYTDVPVGKLILSNEAGVDYSNVKVSLFIKEYMDFPTTAVVERIAAGTEVEIPLLAAFNNRILDIDEDTGVQTEVKAEYYLAGKPHTETRNESLTIYGKNAIVWNQLDMVGSFTTPKDDALAVFTRQLVNAYNPEKGAVNPQVLKAMTVFNGLSAYGIKYLVDPNTPYGKLGEAQMDTVQFPRETLRQRSGDCDDLSVLLAASLSNLGIETAILDVPAHLLMMFNTGVPESQKDTISSNDEALAIIDGEVWVPVEATLIAASFTEAWAEGARKYHQYGQEGSMKIMPLSVAWEKYPPVTLPPADFALTIPSKDVLGSKIHKELEILSVKALERQVRPYRIMLALDPNNTQAQMQVAIVYARNGLFTQAIQELKQILANQPNHVAVLNNLGNINYLQKKYPEALAMYQKALETEPSNADIMVNESMVYYKLGDIMKAKALFEQASTADNQVPERYKALSLLLKQ